MSDAKDILASIFKHQTHTMMVYEEVSALPAQLVCLDCQEKDLDHIIIGQDELKDLE
jgi:hypothetical protein